MTDACPNWSRLREQMLLDPGVSNLNTGSFGPLPRVVFERVTALRQRLAEEPMDFLVREVPPQLWQAREQLAGFMGADPCRLCFAANVTAAINTVAGALRLAAPGEVLLTDQEYGAMRWCWERSAQRQGLSLRTFSLSPLPRSPGEIVDRMRAAVNDRTRLLFFSHVTSPTGLVLPAAELCAEARRRGILTLIDGAHAPAMIPLDLAGLGCDFYTGNCHKWLLAPTGSGFLYFGAGSEDRLQSMQVSWGWHYDRDRADLRDEFGSTPRLRAFEFEGTRDPCPWLAVPTAIDFQENIGWQRIRDRVSELTAHVRERLSRINGLRPATPADPALHGSMTAFWLPHSIDPPALRRKLWEQFHIEAPIVERSEGNLIRVSTWWYNTEEEIDRLAEALGQEARLCLKRGQTPS